MDFSGAMGRALAQAREMQRQISEAANSAAEQVKPQMQKSLADARELQSILTKHAETSSEIAARQAQTAADHLSEFIRLGGEAMRESAEQTRATAQKMVEQSRKVVEAATAANKPQDPPA